LIGAKTATLVAAVTTDTEKLSRSDNTFEDIYLCMIGYIVAGGFLTSSQAPMAAQLYIQAIVTVTLQVRYTLFS
jgi:hypothetical protein